MGRILVANRRGHQLVEWDADTDTVEAREGIVEAERILREARDKGCAVSKKVGGQHVLDAPAPAVSGRALLIVGAVTGFLSSISGTGGPLVLVPILISMRLLAEERQTGTLVLLNTAPLHDSEIVASRLSDEVRGARCELQHGAPT